MTRSYYKILGVSETATPKEIKKVYRELAMKWHPDKWVNKSLEEKEKVNEKMKKINKAFEILGDEDLKKRYDNGETITSDFDSGYDYEAEIKAEAKRNEEELRRKEVQIIDQELEILKLEMKVLDRSSTLNEISAVFCFALPRVRKEDLNPIL